MKIAELFNGFIQLGGIRLGEFGVGAGDQEIQIGFEVLLARVDFAFDLDVLVQGVFQVAAFFGAAGEFHRGRFPVPFDFLDLVGGNSLFLVESGPGHQDQFGLGLGFDLPAEPAGAASAKDNIRGPGRADGDGNDCQSDEMSHGLFLESE